MYMSAGYCTIAFPLVCQSFKGQFGKCARLAGDQDSGSNIFQTFHNFYEGGGGGGEVARKVLDKKRIFMLHKMFGWLNAHEIQRKMFSELWERVQVSFLTFYTCTIFGESHKYLISSCSIFISFRVATPTESLILRRATRLKS